MNVTVIRNNPRLSLSSARSLPRPPQLDLDHRERSAHPSHARSLERSSEVLQATFRSLVDKAFHSTSFNGPGLMVTVSPPSPSKLTRRRWHRSNRLPLQAKGYPDLLTRRFLRAICDHPTWLHRPRPVIFGLFDADPDGINIMQIYRQGSHSLPHERAVDVPEMQWLGIRTDDVLADVQDDEAVLKLTARDRRKAAAMLERLGGEAEAGGVDEQCKIELQKMLMLNIKAEIQILEDRCGGLQGWLERRIKKQLSRSIL
jgi:meiotic recombination protein SPO11